MNKTLPKRKRYEHKIPIVLSENGVIMIPVKVESVSSWTEELVIATRLRNSYRYIHIPLNGSQQISVILLHDHATHATPDYLYKTG
ncbi:hypothetical protein F2Q69_00014263 [Brassica cretica]|uniref:Uncharacterized protein n=1 Tax=Brassica cretica TaxID=69181 RepID=A0A8S9QUE8_BRACR|nr:hypothetical protein F2Q69_00014263 [Brassica cretica]